MDRNIMVFASFAAATFALSVLSAAGITRPDVSEEVCPIQEISVKAEDGPTTIALVRRPKGKGPFPAVVYLHGGLQQRARKQLTEYSTGQTLSRFLAAGYVTVAPTFRSRVEDPQTRVALLDCKAVVEEVRRMPEVDPRSIVVWGTSGGGSLALELAGETQLAAIVAEEPATILFTGILNKETNKPPEAEDRDMIMREPKQFYTPELQKFTREKIAKIQCPILICQGGMHIINRVNNEIFIPELKRAGKDVQVLFYGGEPHGFTRGQGSAEAAEKFFEDAHRFFQRHLRTRPVPIDRSLVRTMPVGAKAP